MDIRTRRKVLGWSQQELATKARCSIGLIRQLENGYAPDVSRSPVYRRVLATLSRAEEKAAA